MKKYNYISWFTLVELIVSISIFSIMMVSVVSIFLFSSQMSTRVELNRAMQENIKNVVEDIAEWVRVSWIVWIVEFWSSNCSTSLSGATKIGFKLCLESGVEYVLWYKHTSWDWLPQTGWDDCVLPSSAAPDKQNCRILKRSSEFDDYFPLTNSFIAFEDIQFIVTNTDMPKVTLILKIRPSTEKGLSIDIIENNTHIIQTTVSERLIKTQ